jgi:cAMP-dependent protein kinase regulator
MGCAESKDLPETAVAVGTGKPSATSTTPAGATPKATPTSVPRENSFKTFRDPSVALRKIVDTSVQMADKVKSTAKAGAVGVQAIATAARVHHVRNIFATPLSDVDIDTYQPPVHPKNEAVSKFIVTALGKNFVFEQLSEKELLPLVQAFESITVPAGEIIITQGDVGDYFYIIGTHVGEVTAGETTASESGGHGQCVFEVDGKEVGRAGVGNSFGELALLYTCPRAATVTATEETTLYRVDQKTFRFILQNQTKQKSQTKGELLQGVDFLKDLDASELFKLASVMTPKRFSEGDYLIRKGDMADYFYLLSEGTLTATDIAVGDTTYEDVVLQPGSYVGERALVTGEPRAANVVAKTDGMAFCIDKDTFDLVLGQLSVLILRSQDKVKLVRIVSHCVALQF